MKKIFTKNYRVHLCCLILMAISSFSLQAVSLGDNFVRVKQLLLKQTGCFLVDYSFTETESLKPGYVRDSRVYDTNSNKTTYELIYAVEKSPKEIRLQHILFTKDLVTGEVQGMLKHQAEDWEYQPAFSYDFVKPGQWDVKASDASQDVWLRKITGLDDGLRYQCAASFDLTKQNPEWSCANFSPIPGRETRDMKRNDYNTLDRKTKTIYYASSWLERQDNVKTILDVQTLAKTSLARELGRTWYIRQSDEMCADAKSFVAPRLEYWSLLSSVWESYYAQKKSFREQKAIDGVPRYAALVDVEDKYFPQIHGNPQIQEEANQAIRAVIEKYRLP